MRLVQLPISGIILDADSVTVIGQTGVNEYHVALGAGPIMPKIGVSDKNLLASTLKIEVLTIPEQKPEAKVLVA